MKRYKRYCPHCKSSNIKAIKAMGLCPLNIWIDFVCKNCGYKWEKFSKVDKKLRENGNYDKS